MHGADLGTMKGWKLLKVSGESRDYLTQTGDTLGPAPTSGNEKVSLLQESLASSADKPVREDVSSLCENKPTREVLILCEGILTLFQGKDDLAWVLIPPPKPLPEIQRVGTGSKRSENW